jgi:hypothetical protein
LPESSEHSGRVSQAPLAATGRFLIFSMLIDMDLLHCDEDFLTLSL